MKLVLLFTCLVMAVYVMPGEAAVKCYVCYGDSKCNDAYEAPESHTTGGCDYCVKSKVTKQGTGTAAEGTVYRACITNQGATPETGCKDLSQDGSEGIQCICDGDKCNSGTTLCLTGAALLSALAMKWLL